jgi:hypothetical protein
MHVCVFATIGGTRASSNDFAPLVRPPMSWGNFKRLYILFLIVKNGDFDEKYYSTSSLFGYLNIAIFFFEFLVSQR